MSHMDAISYRGKRVVITGAASGMGAAATEIVKELGGEIFALDIKPVTASGVEFLETNLGDRASIDAVLAKITGQIDAIFNIAGLPGAPFSPLETTLVNFVGHRHLTDALIAQMPRGGAIANISSVAGMGYMPNIQKLMPLIATSDFDSAKKWLEENPDLNNGYGTSKELLNLWTNVKGKELGEKYGIRINTVGPGVTDTPLLPTFTKAAGGEEAIKNYRGFLGRFSEPAEQAWPIVFLNSAAASFLSGQVIYVDAGFTGALFTGQVDMGALAGGR